MENNSVTKHFFVSLGLIALVLGTFWGGYAYGAKKTYYQYSVPNLKHTEATNISPTAVDFAPFWKAWNILGEKFVSTSTSTGALDDQSKVWGAIAGLTASLGDPYTVFFPPVESKSFSEEISGNFGGIGAELSAKDGVLTVVSPLKGSPAERAGIRSEDAVLAIDSKTTSGLSIDEAINQIRGEIGTSVVLTVLHKDTTSPVDIKIIRDNIEVPILNTEYRVVDKTFVISLYSFSANSAFQFRTALQDFLRTGEKNLIIDLRNNPGGYLEAALDMASWFLPEGDVVVTEDFGGGQENRIYRSKGYNVFKKDAYNVVVLLNKGSASASEILAGALHEQGVATLVGEQSFGKGSVQELVDITPDTSLKVTVARWLTPKGNSISHNGLIPDVVVPFDVDKAKEGIDNQLEKAVEIILKK